ncbi:MAG: hypothetical protein ABSG04_12145, partial [Verrucomicrobiota bacterium]
FIVIRFPFGSLFFFIRTTTFYRKETFLATSPLMLSNHIFAQFRKVQSVLMGENREQKFRALPFLFKIPPLCFQRVAPNSSTVSLRASHLRPSAPSSAGNALLPSKYHIENNFH